jgi:hypothetical protein
VRSFRRCGAERASARGSAHAKGCGIDARMRGAFSRTVLAVSLLACGPDDFARRSAELAEYGAARCEGESTVAAAPSVKVAAVSAADSAGPATATQGALVDVVELPEYPCELLLSLRTVITGTQSGTVPYPVGVVARNSGGQLFTDTDLPGVIAVWDSMGNFITTIGNSGRGPGEMSGWSIPYVGADDKLHVRDSESMWSVFASDGTFIRRYSARSAGIGPLNTIILDDGRTLSSRSQFTGQLDARFVLADTAGDVERAIGTPYQMSDNLPEVLTYSRGSTFWVAREYDFGGDYKLEEWDVSGHQLRALSRSADWLPRRGEPGSARSGAPPLREMRVHVHLEPSGLLVTVVRMNDDGYIELLDPDAGLVLASRAFGLDDKVPRIFLVRSRTGIRSRITDAGSTEIEVIDLSIRRAMDVGRQ